MTKWVDWSKTTRSNDYRGSGSFATFLIIGRKLSPSLLPVSPIPHTQPTQLTNPFASGKKAVCFFLGILFASFPYDFPLLWTSDPVPASYYDQLETHLRFVHQSPPLIARLLNIICAVGFLGFFVKLFRPSEANVLFDGASLVLYVIGVGVYVANIVKGLRSVSAGVWADDPAGAVHRDGGPLTGGGELVLGREDSLKVLSASNTILALVLVGVLVLQAGQWYAERKEEEAAEAADAADAAAAAAAAAGTGKNAASSKKRQ